MQGAKVGTIKGALKTKYGHRDEQLGKRSKGAKSDEADEENEEEMFDKKGKKKGKRKGGLFKKKFKLFAKKALVNKREMEDDDGKQPVLEITGAMEDYVNGDYYPFLKRLRSAIHAKEDTVFNTKLAYKNSHHVILASGTKNDVDGFELDVLKSLQKTLKKGSSASSSSKKFIIKNLKLNNIIISAKSEKLNLDKSINFENLEFKNIGNTKDSKDYKTVLKETINKAMKDMKNKVLRGNVGNALNKVKNIDQDKIKEKIKKELFQNKDKVKNKLKKLLNKN